MKGTNLLLGRETDYPHKYAPEVLCPIARSDSREPLGITGALPFAGVDIWNAWELTWLGDNGHPKIAVVEIRVPAESPNLIESKSLKYYLWAYRDVGAFCEGLAARIADDVMYAVEPHCVRVNVEQAARGGSEIVATAERGEQRRDR